MENFGISNQFHMKNYAEKFFQKELNENTINLNFISCMFSSYTTYQNQKSIENYFMFLGNNFVQFC